MTWTSGCDDRFYIFQQKKLREIRKWTQELKDWRAREIRKIFSKFQKRVINVLQGKSHAKRTNQFFINEKENLQKGLLVKQGAGIKMQKNIPFTESGFKRG